MSLKTAINILREKPEGFFRVPLIESLNGPMHFLHHERSRNMLEIETEIMYHITEPCQGDKLSINEVN